MGDYAITKVILKVKKEYRQTLEDFIEIEKQLEWDSDETAYKEFWSKLGVAPFYYQRYPFGCGSAHAYTTSLGTSDCHCTSDFYASKENFKYKTFFKDVFWFVEFSSKVGQHLHFLEEVVPQISDAWLGLYGDEYSYKPTLYAHNEEWMISNDIVVKEKLSRFINEVDEYMNLKPDEEERYGWF